LEPRRRTDPGFGRSTEGFNLARCTLSEGGNGWVYGRGRSEFNYTFTLDLPHEYTGSVTGNVSGIEDGSGILSTGSHTIFAQALGDSGNFSIDVSLTPTDLPVPELEIIDAKMITPTELGIGVRVTFPDFGQETTRKVRFTAEINGCPVDKTIDITQLTKPGNVQKLGLNFDNNVLPTTPLRIDLTNPDNTENVVGKFTKNESFNLSGVAIYGSEDNPIKSLESLFNVEILLPAVILHGYLHPHGYPLPQWLLGSFFPWEFGYKSISEFLQNKGYERDETYDLYPNYTRYKILWDSKRGAMYTHPKDNASATTIEGDITELLEKVWKLNYASKVKFVGHSFGGAGSSRLRV